MRVGIITFHCSYNYGSALQAYALQKAISSLGHFASIIDYRSRDFNRYHIIRLARPWTIPFTLLRLNRLLKRRQSFHSFWENYFHLTRRYTYRNESGLHELQDSFDCFVCGSDQIWNLDCTGGVVEPFFLSFAGDHRRVAYAPSLAHTSFRLENFNPEKVAKLLMKFDSLSIREEETLSTFQQLVDKKIEVTIDPTLLLNADEYYGMISKDHYKEPYIFVYLLRPCPELVESASKMAESTGLQVYYINDRQLPIPNSLNLFGAGPEEFLSLIAHASAVLTNSFHATVFSVLFHRPFRVYGVDRSSSRMRNLTEKLGISECCVASIDASPIKDENWSKVDRKIDELRTDSWAYLREALS